MYYSAWLQLQLDVTEFTKEGGETTALTQAAHEDVINAAAWCGWKLC